MYQCIDSRLSSSNISSTVDLKREDTDYAIVSTSIAVRVISVYCIRMRLDDFTVNS